MTVKQIAELAGVSIGTVDRVLYRRGRVSPETTAKIEALIAEHNFTPNPIARRLKRNRAYRFYALVPQQNQDSGYWRQVREGIQGGASEITSMGVETEVLEFDRYSPASFHSAAHSILEAKPDGVLFAPIMPSETIQFIRSLEENRIPYVFFDADIPESNPLSTIGQDSSKGGYLAGRLIHLFAGNITGPVAVLDVHGEDYHIIRRKDGFLRYAAETGIKTITKEYFDSSGAQPDEGEMEEFLREHSDLKGIFVTNSSAHRIATVLKKLGKKKDVIIVGYDLIPENHALLKEGFIDAIISQRPATQGRQALLNLYRNIVLDRLVPAKVDIPLDVYIKENVPSELIEINSNTDKTDQ
ncbi:LacI family DNA-binding transcriptional regulator [Breznakiella homolactica]|uniref:LacI family DNA-binding transcriptional regulator n=1 Tax=Breznakiella homolactica TaxID=2798577 RepID=A0A7T7XMH0_9SPIR|nr:LacI family DNA-binding transcriptional regulator [Breznakiella homolactica]QQO09091.1 LacI family DNA-binding transcriptional regulator [Breznakiella homolactica]